MNSSNFKYKLTSNKVPKLTCPNCGAKKHWQRYIDTNTGEVLPRIYGRCDNEEKCGEWNSPYKMGYNELSDNAQKQVQRRSNLASTTDKKAENRRNNTIPAFIPNEVLMESLVEYERNIFVQNLLSNIPFPFLKEDVEKVIGQYYLGTISSGYRSGGIAFPFIDIDGNVRAVQVKQFDQHNHTISTDFLHSVIKNQGLRNKTPIPRWITEYEKNQAQITCLFGEQLLKRYPFNPIALVEAPKTAVYGTLYWGLPDDYKNMIWLAVYNKSSFTFDKVKVLQGRYVIVFPDLSKEGNTYREWENKSRKFEKNLPGTRFILSDLLERLASEQDRQQGHDIADFLIRLDWRKFRREKLNQNIGAKPEDSFSISKNQTCEKSENCESSKKSYLSDHLLKAETHLSEIFDWQHIINDLENFFNSNEVPALPQRMNDFLLIEDPRKFIDGHLQFIKAQNGTQTYLPYLNRLMEFKEFLVNIPNQILN